MEFSRFTNLLVVLGMASVLVAVVSFGLKFEIKYEGKIAPVTLKSIEKNLPLLPEITDDQPGQKLENPPEIIKAVYVTGYSSSSRKYLSYLENLFLTTKINSVVIDIKGSDGIVFWPDNGLAKFFHDRNIYVIGRIAVFEDPVYSNIRPDLAVYNKETKNLWQDYNGLYWLDPSSKEVWDYNISLAKDAFFHGFDEINFDYIRFPSDGDMENLGYPYWDEKTKKSDVIKSFFEYLRKELAGKVISADLFGQTTTSTDDMGIGQLLENAFENFDYISPMIYPSHYINGFMGFENPAQHPYEIVNYSLATALSRGKVKFRPWLQDFNMGATYDAFMVKSEIQATQDALGEDYNGFMLWNSANIYTSGAVPK